MGYLLSGSYDKKVNLIYANSKEILKICIWDIEQAKELNSSMSPIEEYNFHKTPIEVFINVFLK
jgi:hypothetical protein